MRALRGLKLGPAADAAELLMQAAHVGAERVAAQGIALSHAVVVPAPASVRAAPPLLCRVAVLGDASVGKSALVQRALAGGWAADYIATCAPEAAGTLTLPRAGGGEGASALRPVVLLLLDWPGGGVFNLHGARETTAARLLGSADAVALVFDIGSRASLAALSKWARRAQDARATTAPPQAAGRPIAGVLIGAKADLRGPAPPAGPAAAAADDDADLPPRAAVSRADAEELASVFNLAYYEVSALDGTGIDAPLAHIAKLMRADAAAAAAQGAG